MRASIVITVLESREVVRRQLLHFAKMGLREDVELVLVDDGSVPSLWESSGVGIAPEIEIDDALWDSIEAQIQFLSTGDTRDWTQPAARNFGARKARGEYLILTDIDHIVMPPLVDFVCEGKWDSMMFAREVAILDEDGEFVQDDETMLEYGYLEWRLKENKYEIPRHINSFGIRKDLYLELGGMNEHRVGTGKYPNHDDGRLRRRLNRQEAEGKIRQCPLEQSPMLYMFPNGKYTGDVDHNPFGLFHDLSRKNEDNRQWKLQKRGKFKR